ncbi:transferrin-binding protein-like solute binding protein [Actinobacillus equuli subsp. haemolyticus]|uniref:transferrin-binding protein-like solute binding protein n=1 Tax=Actinobacillus equuli TaxID=718 RepID=UPI0024415F7B|nr:transferrin-binding protein-like solute binding protein [Actinobacillus equuli]WGE48889.1 transferrin-binding protein-like solute binding protein [Actinobacillus equuli subsp. equuli]WGE53147.1 transferrin-binding protein-like solute binding protein [Actinobacillus equuli subsp. haemolyticus]WGE57333.1 transferrin-binding protein-like solute binding protein [Actinobacillus equuli subsp. equuli]WGE63405.1 transferrin-binding protein-like solute binding protein [Actinobacillus equuli subsp. ha
MKTILNKQVLNTAATILLSIGVTACSSGGSDQPGIDQSTRLSQVAVQNLLTNKLQAQEHLDEVKQALVALQLALVKAQSANTAEEAQQVLILASGLLENANGATADARKAAKDAASRVSSASTQLSTAADEANNVMNIANQASNVNLEAANVFTQIQAAVADLIKKEEEKAAEQAKKTEQEKKIAINKALTTAVSYNNVNSIVHDYSNGEAREALLAKLQKQGSNAPASCTNAKASTCHKEVARGSVVVNYNQAYSSYAVIRETYDNENPQPNNAFIVLAKESDLTTDRAAVVNATYTGKASYSAKNVPAVMTRDFTLKVENDKVSGSVFQKTVNLKGVEKVTENVALNEGKISVENGVVGFSGSAKFGAIASNAEGSYKGVFVGKNAEEVIGTFETNSTEKASSAQGAFAGKK